MIAPARNRGPAATALILQNTDSQQLARGRRDVSKVDRQLSEPYQPRIMCATADQRRKFEARAGKHGKGKARAREFEEKQRKGSNTWGHPKGRPPAKGRSPGGRGFAAYYKRRNREPQMANGGEGGPKRRSKDASPKKYADEKEGREEQ